MTLEATSNTPSARARPQRRHVCPECGVAFKGDTLAVFCSPDHKNAFHNRQAKRGKVMLPLILAWRGGRAGGGSKAKPTSQWAFSEMCALADLWNAEDRKAGRPAMGSYLTPKMRSGWKAIDAVGF